MKEPDRFTLPFRIVTKKKVDPQYGIPLDKPARSLYVMIETASLHLITANIIPILTIPIALVR